MILTCSAPKILKKWEIRCRARVGSLVRWTFLWFFNVTVFQFLCSKNQKFSFFLCSILLFCNLKFCYFPVCANKRSCRNIIPGFDSPAFDRHELQIQTLSDSALNNPVSTRDIRQTGFRLFHALTIRVALHNSDGRWIDHVRTESSVLVPEHQIRRINWFAFRATFCVGKSRFVDFVEPL